MEYCNVTFNYMHPDSGLDGIVQVPAFTSERLQAQAIKESKDDDVC